MTTRAAIAKSRRQARLSSDGIAIQKKSLRNRPHYNARGKLGYVQNPAIRDSQTDNQRNVVSQHPTSNASRSPSSIESPVDDRQPNGVGKRMQGGNVNLPCPTEGESHSTTDSALLPTEERHGDHNLAGSIEPEGHESGLSSEDLADPQLPTRPALSRLSSRRRARTERVNLRVGRDNNNLPNGNLNESLIGEEELQVAHNRVKLELLEALRDKKAYSAAIIALKEQKDNLQKDVRILRQKNDALESTFTAMKRSKGGKGPVWSMENLRETGIANYQGICLSAGELAKREAMLISTETYFDENDNGTRKRNWTGSATLLNPNDARKAYGHIRFPNGAYGIPTLSMERARNYGNFVSPFPNERGFAKHCIEKTLASPVGSMMSIDEKRECMSLILSHRQTVKKFKSILSDSIGNRKKVTLGVFLRSLGYANGARANSDKLSSSQKIARKLEREIVYDKCVRISNEGNIDTMHWRLSEWSELCLDTGSNSTESNDMEEAEREMESEGRIDNLFMNEAARKAYKELRGHQLSESSECSRASVSILSLARVDASLTTMLKWIKVGGKGGIRNSNVNDNFRNLLPRAMDAIIKEIWDDLECIVPHELVPRIAGVETLENDLFGNEVREWTWVLRQPDDDNYLYLLARPAYFSKKVCSWLGEVEDCYIGICKIGDSKFNRIDDNTIIAEIEESDFEEEENDTQRAGNGGHLEGSPILNQENVGDS